MQSASTSHWEVLSVARFVLAIIVLVGHLDIPTNFPSWWTCIGTYLNPFSAVCGFLLISGYSIADSLERSPKGFLWRRFRRIYPVYLASLLLAAAAILAGATTSENPNAPRFALMVLMMQTFAIPTIWADGQLWSLAVEWWNYALAPLFRRLLSAGVPALIILSLGLFFVFRGHYNEAPRTTGGVMFGALSWLWLAGFLYYRWRATLLGYMLLIFPVLLAACLADIGKAVWIGVFALAICSHARTPCWLGGALRWLGDLSYPVYAIQVPVFAFCLLWRIKSPEVVVAAVLLVAIVVLHAIDLPVRRLRLPRLSASALKRPVPASL